MRDRWRKLNHGAIKMTEIHDGNKPSLLTKIHTYLTQDMTSTQIYWVVTIAGTFSLVFGVYGLFAGLYDGVLKMSSPSTWVLPLTGVVASLAAFTSEINRLAEFSKTVVYFMIIGGALFLSIGSVLVVRLIG